jgi:hypothetical protein
MYEFIKMHSTPTSKKVALVFRIVEDQPEAFTTSVKNHVVKIEPRKTTIPAAKYAGPSPGRLRLFILSRLCGTLTPPPRQFLVTVHQEFGVFRDGLRLTHNPLFCLGSESRPSEGTTLERVVARGPIENPGAEMRTSDQGIVAH